MDLRWRCVLLVVVQGEGCELSEYTYDCVPLSTFVDDVLAVYFILRVWLSWGIEIDEPYESWRLDDRRGC